LNDPSIFVERSALLFEQRHRVYLSGERRASRHFSIMKGLVMAYYAMARSTSTVLYLTLRTPERHRRRHLDGRASGPAGIERKRVPDHFNHV